MGVGHYEAARRHPRTEEQCVLDVAHFQELGRIAERGKPDQIFSADDLAVGPRIQRNTLAAFKPVTLLSAIATVTEHSGERRAGWNIVTSGTVE